MYLNEKELTIFYNGRDEKSKQVLAYAQTLGKKINKQDICNVNVSASMLSVLLDAYGGNILDIINTGSKFYESELKGKDFEIREWFQILRHRPNLVINPLVHINGKTIVCFSATDFYKIVRDPLAPRLHPKE